MNKPEVETPIEFGDLEYAGFKRVPVSFESGITIITYSGFGKDITTGLKDMVQDYLEIPHPYSQDYLQGLYYPDNSFVFYRDHDPREHISHPMANMALRGHWEYVCSWIEPNAPNRLKVTARMSKTLYTEMLGTALLKAFPYGTDYGFEFIGESFSTAKPISVDVLKHELDDNRKLTNALYRYDYDTKKCLPFRN